MVRFRAAKPSAVSYTTIAFELPQFTIVSRLSLATNKIAVVPLVYGFNDSVVSIYE